MKKILILLSILGFGFIGFPHASAEDPMVACTQEMKLCPDGKTYVWRVSPTCEFKECPSPSTPIITTPTVCTKEFAPVCGKVTYTCDPMPWTECSALDSYLKTFPNTCTMKAAKATYMYKWTCQTTDSTPILKYKFRKLADEVLKKYEKKLKSEDISDEKRINKIDILIKKLNNLNSSDKSTTVQLLIKYLVTKLTEMKSQFDWDDLDAVFELFQ